MKRVDPTSNAAKADLGPEVRGQGSSLWWAGQPWFCAGRLSPQQGSSVALASAWLFVCSLYNAVDGLNQQGPPRPAILCL